ncbi:HDOD domain-containing protein [Holophaga foetida]|uniref:HDOD domain-containing protein n=1 Tax=Holophaga foetida TaxID=35839 RepID=UPI0002474285|nr:HDOD domain-containing protein [Holophaga foetida]
MPITPQELIANLGDLPPLPQVAAQVLRLAADPDASMDDLQKVISTDQALTAQILKISNSAMFGMVREVTTLTQAIMTLGFSTIKSVVIASSAKNLYSRGAAGLQERLLWEHALTAAMAGRAFGRCLRFPRAEEVFISGLMHDIGKSVMALKFPERYVSLVKTVYNERCDGLQLELDTFGFDHAMVGEALLHSWNLASSLEDAVRWHHDPAHAPKENQPLAALVALGNQIALDQGAGIGKPETLSAATAQAMEVLGVTPESLEPHRETVLEMLEMDKSIIKGL